MISQQVAKYCARGIIRYLNGDSEQFAKLVSKAIIQYEIEEEKRNAIVTLGEILPDNIKQRMYDIARTA